MSAEQRRRRTMTAKEAAKKLGVSVRQVQRLVAEPREEYLARAAARGEQAAALQAQGRSYAQIAEAMGISVGHVGRILHDHRKRQAKKASEE